MYKADGPLVFVHTNGYQTKLASFFTIFCRSHLLAWFSSLLLFSGGNVSGSRSVDGNTKKDDRTRKVKSSASKILKQPAFIEKLSSYMLRIHLCIYIHMYNYVCTSHFLLYSRMLLPFSISSDELYMLKLYTYVGVRVFCLFILTCKLM